MEFFATCSQRLGVSNPFTEECGTPDEFDEEVVNDGRSIAVFFSAHARWRESKQPAIPFIVGAFNAQR
jgi:hypothetical protein